MLRNGLQTLYNEISELIIQRKEAFLHRIKIEYGNEFPEEFDISDQNFIFFKSETFNLPFENVF